LKKSITRKKRKKERKRAGGIVQGVGPELKNSNTAKV
jgi:hypothetical protein